ncbi:hypothetical protein J7E79_02880 [Bacillus sp. ISL-40]|uniref:hypothetical protein n=1 Tax=unclassified Bacillus (in: firmicutes) TaxID=185979 RepID=UPI001BEC7B77|nr:MULTISPECIES: hypothetical protein [unclassified Bacillus (in: firmicutes)]MBT2696381.1 hypothetical protein [Bacillus sp. ISL-40]MBT2743230.1 hypothetical protein [Bacillus sp. ISL-77]
MRLATVIQIGDCQSYEEEKAQVLKELRALLLTYSTSQETARAYIQNAIAFIKQE